MKKIISFLFITLLVPFFLFPASSTAEETKITFRGIEWNTPRSEVEKQLFDEGAEIGGWFSNPNDIYIGVPHYQNITMSYERVEGGGYRGWYRGLNVAGYTPSATYACYAYPIVDGKVIYDDEKAEFYLGWYSFEKGDFSDYQAIRDDLYDKLTSIYGESNSYNTRNTWRDSDGNYLTLFINKEKDYVNISYMAEGSAVRLHEVLREALEKEAAAAEAEQREKNKDNTTGL